MKKTVLSSGERQRKAHLTSNERLGQTSRSSREFTKIPQAVKGLPTPAERCKKLKALMAPTEILPYGKSTNALSGEVQIHLNVMLDFLSSGGAPHKYDETTKTYKSEHLKKLADWIDRQAEPVIPEIRCLKSW